MKLIDNVFIRKIQQAVYGYKNPVISKDIQSIRLKIPGLSLTDAITLAKFNNGQLVDRNRDELILALLHQVEELTIVVNRLENNK